MHKKYCAYHCQSRGLFLRSLILVVAFSFSVSSRLEIDFFAASERRLMYWKRPLRLALVKRA